MVLFTWIEKRLVKHCKKVIIWQCKKISAKIKIRYTRHIFSLFSEERQRPTFPIALLRWHPFVFQFDYLVPSIVSTNDDNTLRFYEIFLVLSWSIWVWKLEIDVVELITGQQPVQLRIVFALFVLDERRGRISLMVSMILASVECFGCRKNPFQDFVVEFAIRLAKTFFDRKRIWIVLPPSANCKAHMKLLVAILRGR
jgi:hypothetical protein